MLTTLLNEFQLLKNVPEKDKDLVGSLSEPRTFKEGETLFPGHKVCHELFFVCRGVLRIVSTNEKGFDKIHYFYKENQICTILQSFNEGSYTETSIQAACDGEALVITKSKLQDLYRELPYLKDSIDMVNQQQLMDKVRIRNSYLGEDAESQYKLFMEQQPDIALRISLKDVASFLGITPQSLSRIRKSIR